MKERAKVRLKEREVGRIRGTQKTEPIEVLVASRRVEPLLMRSFDVLLGFELHFGAVERVGHLAGHVEDGVVAGNSSPQNVLLSLAILDLLPHQRHRVSQL